MIFKEHIFPFKEEPSQKNHPLLLPLTLDTCTLSDTTTDNSSTITQPRSSPTYVEVMQVPDYPTSEDTEEQSVALEEPLIPP